MVDREDAGWVYYDTTAGDNAPPPGGTRRLIWEGGFASRVSGHVRPRDPGGGTISTGGGTVSTVSPRRMTIDDVSHAVEQSGGTSVGSLRGFDSVDRRDSVHDGVSS